MVFTNWLGLDHSDGDTLAGLMVYCIGNGT